MDTGDLVKIITVADGADEDFQGRLGFLTDIDINDAGATVYTVMAWEKDVKADQIELYKKAYRVENVN